MYVFVIYYDGVPYDHVERKERYAYGKRPKRIYWTRRHAKSALTSILTDLEYSRKYTWKRRDNEPERDPEKFEIKRFRLVEEASVE